MLCRELFDLAPGESRRLTFNLASAYEILYGSETISGTPTVSITDDATGITLGSCTVSGSTFYFLCTLTDACTLTDRTISGIAATNAGPARLKPTTTMRIRRWRADESPALKIGEKRDVAISFAKHPELIAGATLASVTSMRVYDSTGETITESDLTLGTPRVANDQGPNVPTGQVTSVCAAMMVDAVAASAGTRMVRAKVLTSDGYTLVNWAALRIVA